MHCNVKVAVLAVTCLAVTCNADATNENEDVSIASEDFDYHLYARNALEKDAAAIKAEFGDDVDTSLDGYEHLLFARDGDDAGDIAVSVEGYGEAVLEARDDEEGATQSDAEFAAALAKSLAEDDEDYDTIPDGVDEADYQKELDEKNAEDNSIPVERREAEAKLSLPANAKYLVPAVVSPVVSESLIIAPTAAEKKRLGRMKPHYAQHTERVAADLKQFMRRFADDPESGDEEVDVSLEGYDHELVRREAAGIEDGDNDWEEPQEELKGYDHSQLANGGELSPEDEAKYLKEWSEVVARDFDELEDEDEETVEKRGYTRLQKMRKGVKVLFGYGE